jgi:hypothetical protein
MRILTTALMAILLSTGCSNYNGVRVHAQSLPPAPALAELSQKAVVLSAGTAASANTTLLSAKGNKVAGEVRLVSADPSILVVYPTIDENNAVFAALAPGETQLLVKVDGVTEDRIPVSVVAQD